MKMFASRRPLQKGSLFAFCLTDTSGAGSPLPSGGHSPSRGRATTLHLQAAARLARLKHTPAVADPHFSQDPVDMALDRLFR